MQRMIRLDYDDITQMISEKYNVEPEFIKMFVGKDKNSLEAIFPDNAIGVHPEQPKPKCYRHNRQNHH